VDKCVKAVNLLHVLAHTSWGAEQQILSQVLIRPKLDYDRIVYESARPFYLCVLDPIQNHALRLCLGAYRTLPSSSICVEANEPLNFSMHQDYQNPAYNVVFNPKLSRLLWHKLRIPHWAVAYHQIFVRCASKRNMLLTQPS